MKKVSYIDSNLFSPKDAWDTLSMAEKAEMMKVAVQNGITNLQDIREKYNEFAGGGYMEKAKALIRKNEGWSAKPYKDAPKGKSWRSVGWGFNDSGFYDKYPEGISRHYEHGITKAQAEQELNYVLGKADKHLRSIYGKQWDSFNDNQKAAIMDTYYQRPASVGRKSAFYNAVMSGKNASPYLGVKGYGDRNKKRQTVFGGGAVPVTEEIGSVMLPQETTVQPMVQDIPEFIPLNPQVFNTTLPIYQRPELTFEEPVVQETPVSPYSPEEIERQERVERLANLGRFLSFTNTSGSNNIFLNTIGMLTGNTFAEGGDTNDADLIDWIIREEGFNKKPEDIGDGKITLGSGLTDPKWHALYKKRGNKWSAEDNRMAVAEEVANRRKWAEKNIPNWDTLPDSSQKALLSYKYNYNFTSANSPKLFQALRDSNLYEAAKQMDATSKDPKFKKGLMDRRKREQEWFLSDVTGNTASTQVIPVQASAAIGISMPSITAPAVSTAVRNNYIPTTTTPYNRGNNMKRAFESAVAFNRMMDAASIPNNPLPEYPFPISYADGGDLNYSYTKPLNNVFVDEEGNLLDSEVPSAKGTIRTPEVIVTARDPRKPVPTAFDRNEDLLRPIMDFVPGVGDALQAKDAVTDAMNGDYVNAGIGAGMLFVPNMLEKPIKYLGKGAKKLLNTAEVKKVLREITDAEWDTAYNAAIKSGDMDEVQRLRDLHFTAKAPDTKIITSEGIPTHAYHGTGKKFTEFDTTGKYSTLDEGYYGVGAYFTPNKELAQMYADTEKMPTIYDTYLNIENPLRHVRDENADLYGKAITGNDGVISVLPEDLVDDTFDMTEFVATKPNQIKSADAITYDDAGNIIPLSQRDTFNINDIRYGLLPFSIGLTGYGLWQGNE